jgi:carboxymethylenebutenolidase
MIRTEEINAGRVNGHISHAERPCGGVLLLPTITGVDAHARERARALTEAGLTTLIWNPYPGEAPPTDMASAQALAAKLSDAAVETMSECVTHLLDKLRLPAVAVLGFCLGGRYAVLLAAKDHRLAACVSYYPSIRIPMGANQALDAIALAADIRCPVQLIHGTADEVFVHAAFLRLREALDQRKAVTMVQVHPGAVHSFMRPNLHTNPANAVAARLSWPPVVSFLESCLGGAAAAAAHLPA